MMIGIISKITNVMIFTLGIIGIVGTALWLLVGKIIDAALEWENNE
jgi:hypothetical protein